MSNKFKVALVGAGSIAPTHLTALRGRRDVDITAIVDPSRARAEALAAQVPGAAMFASVEELLAGTKPDVAHVLTPPPYHLPAARPLLEAGVHVMLEKPMAQSSSECATLMEAAKKSGAALRINHNFVHHPAFARARKIAQSGRFGPVRQLQMRFAAPLRQMTARAFGHWMFNSPKNLLLEQAVHPLSQIDALLGPIEATQLSPGPVRRPAEGIELITSFGINLDCEKGPAQLQIALGSPFLSWTATMLCDDGVIEVDIPEGRILTSRPHNQILPMDNAQRNLSRSASALGAAARGLTDFTREILRLGPPSDGFNQSVTASVNDFYTALSNSDHSADEAGPRLVAVCEDLSRTLSLKSPSTPGVPPLANTYDVAVLGGTGFIGRHVVRQLLDKGKRVAVLARSIANLPEMFHDPRVGLFPGSISDPEAVRKLVSKCPLVVNLAHGGGGATREAIADAMVGGARVVAEACEAENVRLLLFVSSSAALYLGDPDETVTMETPADPQPDERADYARAKILAEKAMAEFDGVPIAILRPAIVVGADAPPFHSALGAYENETHCQGWNAGKNPLPFILAGDVASAIVAALEVDPEKLDGKTLNLVGDVRRSARQYTEALADASGRPLKFHAGSPRRLLGVEWVKWGVKKVAGRKGLQNPSSREFKSRGMVATIDTTGEKELLGWQPCDDDDAFFAEAIAPHTGRPA